MKKEKLIKIDGANLHILGDLVYIDEEYYTHFYRIEDAFKHYKDVQQSLNKNISFKFFDNDIYITKDTTLDNVKEQIIKENEAREYIKKENQNDFSKIKTMYESYLIMNNDTRCNIPSVERVKGKYKIK